LSFAATLPTLCQNRKGWGTPFHLWDTACYKGIVGHPPTCPQGLKPESGTDSIPAAEAVGFHDSADGRDGDEAKKN